MFQIMRAFIEKIKSYKISRAFFYRQKNYIQPKRYKLLNNRYFYLAATIIIIASFITSILLPSATVKAQSQLTWTNTADFYKNKSVLDNNSGACQTISYSGLSISGSAYSDATCASNGAASSLTLGLTTANLTNINSINSSNNHSVALKNDGTVWAWGQNQYGQLGNNTTTNSSIPVQVKDDTGNGFLTDVKFVAAGTSHSLAVKNDGTVWAWGYNYYGQLGNNTTTNSYIPVQVKDAAGTGFLILTDVKAVVAGNSHSLAVKNDGTAWAWGNNQYGQLGNNTTTNSFMPVQVKDAAGTGFLTDIKVIAAGSYNYLVAKNDGTLWAWGNNGSGQLGNGTLTHSSIPVQVKDATGTGFLTGITDMASGANQSLAVKNDGTLWAWGYNGDGRLGDGTTIQSLIPVQVKDGTGNSFLTDVKDVSTGNSHSLAVKNDGTVWAWGTNYYGELGESTYTNSSKPVQVKDAAGTGLLAGITTVAAGNCYSLSVKNDGTVWAWGDSQYGQLGDNTTTQKNKPVQVKDAAGADLLTDVKAVAAGTSHSLAVKNDGTVWAWGDNSVGQLGDNTTTQRATPVQVKDAAGTGFLTNVKAVVAGDSHSLAVKNDGTLWAWGNNGYGRLGDNTTVQKNKPVQVKDAAGTGFLTDVKAVAAGTSHSLAVKNDGTAWAWGYNLNGQLGNATATDSSKPVQVKDDTGNGFLTNVNTVAAGGSHSLAVKNDGTAWAWGFGNNGQLGNGATATSTKPVQIKDAAGTGFLTGVTAIAAGSSHSLAVKNNDTSWSWGYNYYRQLGDSTNSDKSKPVNVLYLFTKTFGSFQNIGVLSEIVLDIGPNRKTATYSINWNSDALPANTSIGFMARVGNDNKVWSSWSALTSQTATGSTNGTADLSSLAISRYVELKAVLTTTNTAVTPKLNDFTLNYMRDITAPNNPTKANLFNGATDLTVYDEQSDITQNQFFNYSSPTFKFYGASDPTTVNSVAVDQSGIAGYYVYFGQDNSTAYTAGTYQSHTSSVLNTFNTLDPQTFTPSTSISAEGNYYLRVATVDIAGNISTPTTLFTYKYDKTPPTNVSSLTVNPFGWSSVNNFTFNWAASTDLFGQGQSGVLGYQYKINDGDDNWLDSSQTVSNQLIISNSNKVVSGRNDLYIRAIDNAGNVSSIVQHIYFYYTGNAPSAPTSLTVDPITPNTSNSFTFSWLPPSTVAEGSYRGEIIGYRYSVNSPVNDSNSVYVKLGDLNKTPAASYDLATGRMTLTNIPAATKVVPNTNTIYVMAIGTDGVNDIAAYGDEDSMAQIDFFCNTSAPGLPTNTQLFDTSNRETSEYSVTVKWTAPSVENSGIGVSGYDVYRSIDNIDFGYPNSPIGSSTGTSFVDAGVSADTNYYYAVRSRDSANNTNGLTASMQITPTGAYTKAPDITDGPVVIAKVSTAEITWTTATDDTLDQHKASSFVEIGEDAITALCKDSYGLIQGQMDYEASHKVIATGLNPESTYHYRVKFVDKDGNIGCSDDDVFTTQPAPRVERVSIQDIRLYTAILTWYTSEPATSDLIYGKTSNYSDEIKDVSGGMTTVHSVRLDNLDHSSTYHFAIRITDVDGNQIMSDDYSFETLQYPKLSNVRFQPMADQSTSTFKVTWDSNVPTTSVVEFKPEGGKQQEAVKTKLETKHEIIVSGLMDNTYYLINTVGVDQYGNSVSSDLQRIKTDYDTRPPVLLTPATEVSSSDFGSNAKSQVIVSWETDEPSTSQVEYGIGVSGDNYDMKSQEDATLTTSHVVIITGMLPSSSYHLRAVSKDGSGNKGVSESMTILTEQAKSSVLDLIVNSLQSSLGWLFGLRN